MSNLPKLNTPRNSASESNRLKIFVGIDLGTTFTGISWCDSRKATVKDVEVLKKWPGPSKGRQTDVWKTPTTIAYKSENAQINASGNTKDRSPKARKDSESDSCFWGYQVKPAMKSYTWFKLRLDDNAKLTTYDDISVGEGSNSHGKGLLELPPGKSAEDICADFLKCIHDHFMAELECAYTAAMIKATPMEFWVTVPAIWSDQAKSATKSAAKRAGFCSRPGDEMFLISEPEAAAAAAISKMTGEGLNNGLRVGDGVLICDCGGGTCDLTTYRILTAGSEPTYEELVVGEGGKCGSTYVDRQFHHWLASRFGKNFTKLGFEQIGPGSDMMKEFEQLKIDFETDHDEDVDFRVPLVMADVGHSEFYKPQLSQVVFQKKDMEAFFAPAVEKVLALLEEQITCAKKDLSTSSIITIVLCGGFGDSSYLLDKIKDWSRDRAYLKVIRPLHPQAAIVRGAALRGVGDTRPSRRRCRRSYGFDCGEEFREGIDPESESYIDRWSKEKYCNGRMTWQVAKGDYITEDTKVTADVEMIWEGDDDDRTFTVDLWSCTTDEQPEYLRTSGIERVGTIKVDFTGLPKYRFKSCQRQNQKIWLIEYQVQVFLAAKSGVLTFQAVIGNRPVGKTEIKYATNK
ncbi:actin-like ATPase domain-containing protein [Tothia fuscella]|uniref:Actin-like ATPase domain-containing protein n=1 Tax=Tothia fuscella TaxID=1048955 RepID=A0A9P4NPS3_9PEZI|nr:actin-like ATPase domain-containing protein [Tothia fuscella]